MARWFADRFPGDGFGEAVAAELRGRAVARPPAGQLGAGHWAEVGGAVGTRLAWAVEPAPPYYGLWGAYRAGLGSWATVNAAAAAFPTHRDRPVPGAGAPDTRLCDRPSPGGWLDTAPPPGELATLVGARGSADDLVGGFATRTGVFLEHHRLGALGDAGRERVLARVAVAWTGWESAYRGGSLGAPRAQARRALAAPDPVAALLGGQDPAVLADTAGVLAHAERAGLFEVLAGHAHPRGVGAAGLRGWAFPVFAEGWADGDLLLDPGDGAATTLIDVKTVISVRDPAKVLRWGWQLLGYAYLAAFYATEWRVGRVGLCFARHAHVLSWDLDELAAVLAAGSAPVTGAFGRYVGEFGEVLASTLAARGLRASAD